jgi:hypothetical protein
MKDFAVAFIAAALLIAMIVWCVRIFYLLFW